MKDSYIIKLLDWSTDFVKSLERKVKDPKIQLLLQSMSFPTRLTTLFGRLKDGKLPPLPKLREVLPELLPPRPTRIDLRNIICRFLNLPPPPLPDRVQLLEEIERAVDLLLQDLERDTRMLVNFFDEITPESIPWIVDLFKKEPSGARTTLGESLCVWWLRMVLSQSKDRWLGTYGPIKTFDIEIDTLSVRGAIAEIKNARPGSEEYEGACGQLAERCKAITQEPSILRSVVSWMPREFKLMEAAIVTLYRLGDYKEEIKERLVNRCNRGTFRES